MFRATVAAALLLVGMVNAELLLQPGGQWGLPDERCECVCSRGSLKQQVADKVAESFPAADKSFFVDSV